MPSKIRQTQGQGEFPANSFKYSPLEQVRTLYVGFCQGLFAAAPPGTYRWSPSLEETEIVITDESPIHVNAIGKRPALSFSRGPVQSQSLGFDDMLSYDYESGKKRKSILVPGMMNINSCSRSDLESERIAWVVAEQLWLHRELLMRAGFFEIGRQFVIGSPTPAGSIVSGDSGDEWVVTTVSSPFQFYRTSQITPLGRPILDSISMQFAHEVPGGPASISVDVGRSQSYAPPDGTIYEPCKVVATTAPGVLPGRVPHPLNPSKMVTVRPAKENGVYLREPAIGGRTIPMRAAVVEQSGTPTTIVSTTKV